MLNEQSKTLVSEHRTPLHADSEATVISRYRKNRLTPELIWMCLSIPGRQREIQKYREMGWSDEEIAETIMDF